MKKAVLASTLLSIILLTTSISAETKTICDGKHCFIDLSKLSSSRTATTEITHFSKTDGGEVLAPKVEVDNSPMNNIETIVLDHDKYVMTIAEVEEYEMENLLTQPMENIENRIIEGTKLPTSEFYCENNTKPIYHSDSDSFECA